MSSAQGGNAIKGQGKQSVSGELIVFVLCGSSTLCKRGADHIRSNGDESLERRGGSQFSLKPALFTTPHAAKLRKHLSSSYLFDFSWNIFSC